VKMQTLPFVLGAKTELRAGRTTADIVPIKESAAAKVEDDVKDAQPRLPSLSAELRVILKFNVP
jgi:hypothetical protein